MSGKNFEMDVDVSGVIASFSQQTALLEQTIVELPHNSFDAGSRSVKVILYKADTVSLIVDDSGHGLFSWIPEEDDSVMKGIKSGSIQLNGSHPADKLTKPTSAASFPYVMRFAAASMKRSMAHKRILEIFAKGGGRIPESTVGVKATGILGAISKCQYVEFVSRPHVSLARYHFGNNALSQDEVPITGVRLPTQEGLKLGNREYIPLEVDDKMLDLITNRPIPYGTRVTLYNIEELNDLKGKRWDSAVKRLANAFAESLRGFLLDDELKFEFWVIEEVYVGGRKNVNKRPVSITPRISSGEIVLQKVFETSNGFLVDVDIRLCNRTDERKILFGRSRVQGHPVSEVLIFGDIWADSRLTGVVEILAPPEHDLQSWDKDKRLPMPSYPPMLKALKEIVLLEDEIEASLKEKEEARQSSVLSEIGELCRTSLMEILAADDELVDLVDLPVSLVQKAKRERRKSGRGKERINTGIKVHLRNEHGESLQNDIPVVVTLVQVKGGQSGNSASFYAKFGNVDFGEVHPGEYRIKVDVPDGMSFVFAPREALEPFTVTKGEGKFYTFVIQTNRSPRNRPEKQLRFEFHADPEDAPLVDFIDLSAGVVYININGPMINWAYKTKNATKLAEAIVYPVVLGLMGKGHAANDDQIRDKALRVAQQAGITLEPLLKASLRKG